ncbi:MAG: LysR family transcriptional regulator [Cytophagales bacterium]|nr:LysR family transcriptional regulator [Rhizobacter sp.]
MSRLLPPPHLLRALIATARHGSVVRAAEELHLTAGAVSKQLLELERRFGITLFERVRKRLALTEAGQRYVERVAPLLDEIERVTLDLLADRGPQGASEPQVLHLSMLPTIGAKWVIPRLADFLARHPQVDLRFIPFIDGYDFSRPELDCAIRYGRGVWPGAEAHYLLGHEILVIAPPGSLPRLRVPADVLGFTLLHHVTEPQGWARWCEGHGVSGPHMLAGPRMDQVASQLRAVMAGMGLALVPRCLVEEELEAGLVEAAPFPVFVQQTGYYFCYPDNRAQLPALQAFRGWLLAQV